MGPATVNVVTSTQEDRISPVLSNPIMQYIFEKCTKTPSRGTIGCGSNIPGLKKDTLYNLMAMIGQ